MTDQPSPRRPRVFTPDDPAVLPPAPEPMPFEAADAESAPGIPLNRARRERSLFSWGSMLVSAMAGLATLAAGVWFARFVSVTFARDDWVGWTATALLSAIVLAGAVIIGREIVGLWRLQRLAGLRKDADLAIAARDLKAEAAVARKLVARMSDRSDLSWPIARFREHQGDVHDAGELLALADRELLVPLDVRAKRIILASAKRVATVTALSPIALIAVGFVAYENLSMMRTLAGLYGGRPGFLGGLRLARMVIGHLVATGGIALTDDLLGQFLGQDVLRRLSRRLGEGAFNGALTARIGCAAVDVTRPLPFIEAPPIRARDFVAELFRNDPAAPASPAAPGAKR